MKRSRRIWLALCALVCSAAGAVPSLRAQDAPPFRRTVLALFNAPQKIEHEVDDPVHAAFELPLNWLGLRVHRRDIADGPPPEEWLAESCAVMTVFMETGDPPPAWLWPWLERAVLAEGRRVVHLRTFGPLAYPDPEHESTPRRLCSWLEKLGCEAVEGFAKGVLAVDAQLLEPEHCAFEADPLLAPEFGGPRSVSPANEPWVVARWRSLPSRPTCHPVVVGPWGGIALDPWVLQGDEEGELRHWLIDPYEFLRHSLGWRGVPAPEPNVRNGRRLFFLHVDGDGFESLSQVRRNAYCAEILEERILQRYDLPFTVSVIVASLTDDLDVEEPTDRMRLASRILMAPNVEVASHTVLHPLIWAPDPSTGTDASAKNAFASLKGYRPSQVAEVRESVRFIDHRLLERGKRCEVVLWSGDTSPSAEAIEESYRLGCTNLNGGTFRWDQFYNSCAFSWPYLRRRGGAVQVYCGAGNETDFDGFFTTHPSIFGKIDQTIENSGRGRILKPANVYIHFYSAYHPGALAAIERLVDRWAYAEPTIPVHASRFSRSVLGFDGAQLERDGDGWRVSKHGELRTLRFDHESRIPDLSRCEGVLGWKRIGDSLFVHLAGERAARVHFADASAAMPFVEESNCELELSQRGPEGLTLRATGYAERLLALGGFAPDADVPIAIDGTRSTARADAEGRIVLRWPGSGTSEIRAGHP